MMAGSALQRRKNGCPGDARDLASGGGESSSAGGARRAFCAEHRACSPSGRGSAARRARTARQRTKDVGHDPPADRGPARSRSGPRAARGLKSVCNVVHLEGVARRPEGDVILADVAREDASVVIADLSELGIHRDGVDRHRAIDTQISEHAERAVEHAKGAPADAVVWEEVEARTSENVELSGVFLAFMVLAGLIAMVGIYQDSPILIVGAMVVGPEFGPLAGLCVALVQRRSGLAPARRSRSRVGFPLGIAVVYVATLALKATGLFEEEFTQDGHSLANIIS